jgi:hypothetical protein
MIGRVQNIVLASFEKLRAERVELNKIIRREKLARSCVPCLAQKPWAQWWQKVHRGPMEVAIRRAQRKLREISRVIGPPPKVFQVRPVPASELKRMQRMTRAWDRARWNQILAATKDNDKAKLKPSDFNLDVG